MVDVKRLEINDVIIDKVNKIRKRVKYIASNYIIAEDCKNGHPSIIVKDRLELLYTKRKKYVWTDWKKADIYFNDPFNKDDIFELEIHIECEVRSNGKRVQVRSGALSAMASCNEDCGDKFDFDKGMNIAARRFVLKWLSNRLEAQLKG